MPDKRNHPHQSLPVANYSSAIARAVEWLGDRYLLAKPINSTQSRITGDRARFNALWQSKSKSFASMAS
jgi:hypothetical protein